MGLTSAQRAVIESGLSVAREYGFALAGSGALIEHGLSERLTNDTDWFSTFDRAGSFNAAADAVSLKLSNDGNTVQPVRRSDTYLQILVKTPGGESVEVDMGLDWRRYHPAEIAIGPVLNIQDAVAAKVATIYSRGEARDFIDLWSIRQSAL